MLGRLAEFRTKSTYSFGAKIKKAEGSQTVRTLPGYSHQVVRNLMMGFNSIMVFLAFGRTYRNTDVYILCCIDFAWFTVISVAPALIWEWAWWIPLAMMPILFLLNAMRYTVLYAEEHFLT